MKKAKSPTILPVSDKLNQTQRKSIGAGTYKGPRQRLENEALPMTFNTRGQRWSYESMNPVRPGANDHLRIKSVGIG
jgi:hypothetical protein